MTDHAGAGGPGIDHELRRIVRLLGVTVTVAFVIVVALAALTTLVLEPRLQRDLEVARALRELHEAVLVEHAALQGWLTTGDESFRERASAGRAAAVAQHEPLTAAATPEAVDILVAQQRWYDQWADPAREADPGSLEPGALAGMLREGAGLLAPYRHAQRAASEAVLDRRDAGVRTMVWTLLGGLLGAGALTVGLFGLVLAAGRRARRMLVEPLEDLLATMDRIGHGELEARPSTTGPSELRELGSHLTTMADALGSQRGQLEAEQQLARSTADALREILRVAREIAGSLSTRYVAETVAGAATRLSDADRAVLWMTELDDERLLYPLYDSSLPRGSAPTVPSIALGDGAVGVAAHDARVVRSERQRCYPLVVGGRTIGVLELQTRPGTPTAEATREALETLAIQAAAALQAARLHRQADELSQVDGLTGIANRRRMEADLAVEFERARRYGRPLAFVMADVDHFKRLNDTYGHPYGDAVLRDLAEVLTGLLRSTDSLYRYGGEEFVLLARETDAEGAAELAERLRHTVERRPEGNGSAVTMSFGVAAVPTHAATLEELVGAADRALYEAKQGGRNRVVVADPTAPPTTIAHR